MDLTSDSLVDLLRFKSPDTSQKSVEKDSLLALLTPQGTSSSQARFSKTPQSHSPLSGPQGTRNSNANDLLASLMGKASPRSAKTPESRAAESASLLSTLMGSTGVQSTSNPGTMPTNPTSPPARSYVNPRHEFLASNAEETPSKVQPVAEQQPTFHVINPFEELEVAMASSRIAAAAATIPKVEKVVRARQATPPKAVPQAVPVPNEIKVEHIAKPDEASPVALLTQPQAASIQIRAALRIPDVASSVCKIPTTALHRTTLSVPTPVTKMIIKPDQSNRNIIAASRRYFAYPVPKDSSVCAVRIVDQDTGETALLEQHSTRVIDLSFGKSNDENGTNALVTTDVDSNIVVWAVAGAANITKVLEIAGPSDANHKSRVVWSQDGTYFGVSITSRLYVFDYRALVATPKAGKIKLHPDSKHAICVCKADKAIRAISFSADKTGVAAVDKSGKLRLWNLSSNGKSIDATASIALSDRSLMSIEFVGPAHVVVGTTSNDALLLVDIKAAKIAQEIALPAVSEYTGMHFKLQHLPINNLLLTYNESRQSLFILRIELPAVDTQTSATVEALSEASSHFESAGRFTSLLEFGIPNEHHGRFLGFSSVENGDDLDCFAANERGYNLHSLKFKSLLDSFATAKSLDSSTCTKLKYIGQYISSSASQQGAEEVRRPVRQSSHDGEHHSVSTKAQKKTVQISSQDEDVPMLQKAPKKTSHVPDSCPNGILATEPRTAEIAAKIEAGIKASVMAEIQKSNTLIKSHVESLQKNNDTKHEAILRLVSETLSKNTSKLLRTTLNESIEKSLVPLLKQQIDSALQAQLPLAITELLDSRISRELSHSIKDAVDISFTKCDIVLQLNNATTSMTHELTTRHQRMEQSLAGALVRLDAQILERQKADSEKIDRMLLSIEALQEQMNTLSASINKSNQAPPPPLPQQVRPPTPAYPTQNIAIPISHNNTVLTPAPVESFARYHDLIMDFVGKSQRIDAGDFEGVPFIKQFLSWRPDNSFQDGICRSLASDQLQLLAFIHALVSQLQEDDAYIRVTWVGSALQHLKRDRWDPRLEDLGPRLFNVICKLLYAARELAQPVSQYRKLLVAVCNGLPIPADN